MQCACQLWGQKNQTSLKQIQILQNRASKITYKKHHDSANLNYKEFYVFKLKDLIYLQNCFFVLQIEQNKELAASFPELKYCGKSHNYMTWLAVKILLHIPINSTDRYGKQCPKFNCILNQDDLSYFKLKTLTKDHIINKYWTIHETYVISLFCIHILPRSFPFLIFFLLFPSFHPFYFHYAFFLCYLFFMCIDYTIKHLTYNLYNKILFDFSHSILVRTCSQT